jgi:hypothetical protein
MDSLKEKYRSIIEKILKEYADFMDNDPNVKIELVFDRNSDHYLLIEAGWLKGEQTGKNFDQRIYGTLIHIDIIDDKIWIQHDGTEEGVAYDLLNAEIPKLQIVLAYKSLERRKLTGFALA